MTFCSIGTAVAPAINALVVQNRDFLLGLQPYSLGEHVADIPPVSIRNAYLYGLHNTRLRDGSKLTCDNCSMEAVLNLNLKDMRAVFDWKVSSGMFLKGKADVSVGMVDVDVTAMLPAEQGGRIVLESIKILEVENVRVNITGPLALARIDFNAIVDMLLKSSVDRRPLFRIIELVLINVIQQIMDGMKWPI